MLIEAKADASAKDKNNNTPIVTADTRVDIVELLVEAGGSVTTKNVDGSRRWTWRN